MRFKNTLIAGLLGCTMLAGCNGSDDKNPTTPDTSQSTFDTLKNEFDQLKAESEADQTRFADMLKALAEIQERLTLSETDAKNDVAELQSRMTAVEIDLAALKALGTRINTLENALEDVGERTLPVDDLARLTTLHGDFATLKKDYDAAIKLKLEAADIADLLAAVETLKTDKADQGTIAKLRDAVQKLQEDLAASQKLGATSVNDFTNRVTALEDALYKLLNPRTDMALTQFVDLFVGTTDTTTGGGHSGNLNPGAQTPFGMVSFGPDTMGSGSGWGYGSGGYYYKDSTIQYFSMTHLNGPGCRGQGAVAILPQESGSAISTGGVGYSHANESAEPGYYKVKFNNNIVSELTATTRTGMARFTWPDATKAFLTIDATRNNSNKSGVASSMVDLTFGADKQSLSGKAIASPFCEATWSQPVYFYATFDKKLKNTSPVANAVATLQFDLTDADKTVQLKVGISSVSAANAKANLEAENPGWMFDGPNGTKTKSSTIWNQRLNTIQIDLAKPENASKLTAATANYLKQFYSAFYRVYSGPTVFSDVNGDYRSMKQVNLGSAAGSVPQRATENVANYKFTADGKDASYKTHYSGFSMWDTYRSAAQLVAFIAPDEASDMMQSLVADAQQCGAFPHWVDGSEDTTPMQGDHAPNVVAGSYMFGARGFDLDNARKFMRQSASNTKSACNNKSSSLGQLGNYIKNGYVNTADSDRASSNTLEMITTDGSIGAFLQALPETAEVDQAEIQTLFKRAANWKNIFNDSTKTLGARNAAGAWQNGNFFHESTEPNYFWSFAQDWTALIDRLGFDAGTGKVDTAKGKAAAITRLNTLFSIPASTPFTGAGAEPTGRDLNGGEYSNNYYIGNEPAFQTPWAYNWAGAPKYAQYIIPVIMRKNFMMIPGGLPGNDDMGATSAWYVWAALGLYPVVPSAPGLAVSTPQFAGATVWLGNGKKLRIETDKEALLGDVRYINEMKLNGATYQGSWLPLDKIRNGGTLSFTLSATPTEWGTGDNLAPPSGPGADYSKATAKEATGVQIVQ